MVLKYRGANVLVPRTADIPQQFLFKNERSRAIQRVLDTLEPWKQGDNPVVTEPLDGEKFMPIVAPLNGRKPMWGIHAGHHARVPQASPFIRVDHARTSRTNLFTIELEQSPGRPKLVRAYPGSYIPPLPWMGSANDVNGGRDVCVNFWRAHAYIYSRSVMLSEFEYPPRWFRP